MLLILFFQNFTALGRFKLEIFINRTILIMFGSLVIIIGGRTLYFRGFLSFNMGFLGFLDLSQGEKTEKNVKSVKPRPDFHLI